MKARYTLARKIAIMWVVATVPLLASTVFYIVFYANREIAFTRAELAGVALLRPMDPLVDLLHAHEILSRDAGNKIEGAAARLAANQASIESSLAQFDRAMRAYKAVPPARVAARASTRLPLDLSGFRLQLAQACRQSGDAATTAAPAGDATPAGSVRDAIRRVGNSSNLILDTDLDSFSLVDLLVAVLPRAQERLTRIEDLARDQAQADGGRQAAFSTFADQVEESDLAEVASDLRTAIDENRAFRDASPSLQSELPSALQSYSDAQYRLVRMLTIAGGGPSPRDSAADLGGALAGARAASLELWSTGAKELEKLLSERLRIYESYRLWGFAFIYLSFLSSTIVAAIAGRSIAGRMRAETEAQQEMKRLNAELELRIAERTAQLTATVGELEAFSYSVSHDLRNPLRAVDGFSLVLLEDYAAQLDETARDYLARIRRGSQRMGLLIDDLLKLSRVSRVEMAFSEIDLSAMAGEIVEQLRHREPERAVAFECQRGLTGFGDPSLVHAVLVNLLENAWKYTRRNPGARIEFLRQAEPSPEGAPVFVLRDNGAGFDMRYAGKLFSAFQRLHSASEFEGTGVGLATVQRILARHGGHIRAEGAVDKGASFFFSLAPGHRN